MALTLEQNLVLAKAALNHTASKLPLGAQNDYDNPTKEQAETALLDMRAEIVQLQQNTPIYRLASFAKGAKAGNCGEQAAVAFEFLKNHGVFPLDLMRLTNGDHAWIVIGRATRSESSDYKTWGNAAVICDPWSNMVKSAQKWGERDIDDGIYTSVVRVTGPAVVRVKSFEV